MKGLTRCTGMASFEAGSASPTAGRKHGIRADLQGFEVPDAKTRQQLSPRRLRIQFGHLLVIRCCHGPKGLTFISGSFGQQSLKSQTANVQFHLGAS